MKTHISPNNPFRCSRYAFAFECIEENKKYLDYGCHDGKFIHAVKKSKNVDFIGIDKNKDIIEKNPFSQNIMLFKGFPLPFDDETFDGITVLDVLEHIYDQNTLLRELNRVLKKGGKLIITVPKKHIFSFLDVGNFKFIFPTLHKIFYTIKYSKQEYEFKYKKNPSGLIGDIEREKSWHQHFSEAELINLLEKNGFKIRLLDGSSLFGRVFILLDILKVGRILIPSSIREKDCLRFEQMNLFCEAIKK